MCMTPIMTHDITYLATRRCSCLWLLAPRPTSVLLGVQPACRYASAGGDTARELRNPCTNPCSIAVSCQLLSAGGDSKAEQRMVMLGVRVSVRQSCGLNLQRSWTSPSSLKLSELLLPPAMRFAAFLKPFEMQEPRVAATKLRKACEVSLAWSLASTAYESLLGIPLFMLIGRQLWSQLPLETGTRRVAAPGLALG